MAQHTRKKRFTPAEIEEMNRKQLADLAIRKQADDADAKAQKAGKRAEKIKQRLTELNPKALVMEGMDSALVGYASNEHDKHVAVYQKKECLKIAETDFDFEGVTNFAGENGPIFIDE